MSTMSSPLLEIDHLSLGFTGDTGMVQAVDRVSLWLHKGETVGLVGESGCGKSVTAMSILRLITTPPAKYLGGEIRFAGQNLLTLGDREIRGIRGNRIGMIFQEPMTSLNPVYTVGDQIAEVFRVHRGATRKRSWAQAIEMLHLVQIPAAAERARAYPHQLSGGMRQRVMIAMALACKPQLLIADEPTTALDVTIQAQILRLIADLQRELDMAVLLITHDLGVVAEVCQRVEVMYAGQIVESGQVREVFAAPHHPYTFGLLASIPRLGRKVERLTTIEGTVPALGKWPVGCHFSNRCPHADAKCRAERPELVSLGSSGRMVACWKPLATTATGIPGRNAGAASADSEAGRHDRNSQGISETSSTTTLGADNGVASSRENPHLPNVNSGFPAPRALFSPA